MGTSFLYFRNLSRALLGVDMIVFNLNSPQHLSVLLFGGTLLDNQKEPMLDSEGMILRVKSGKTKGQIKTRIVEKEIKIAGLGIKPDKSWETKKKGIYQTNEPVLVELLRRLKYE